MTTPFSVPGSDKLLCPGGIALTKSHALREALADPEWHKYHDAIRAELEDRGHVESDEPVTTHEPEGTAEDFEREHRAAMAF